MFHVEHAMFAPLLLLPDAPPAGDLTWQVLSILSMLIGLASGAVALLAVRRGQPRAPKLAPPAVIPSAILESHPGAMFEQVRRLGDEQTATWKRQDELRDRLHALELHISERYVNHDDLNEVKDMLARLSTDLGAMRSDFTRVFQRALERAKTE